jgi:type II secretory pathway component PulF
MAHFTYRGYDQSGVGRTGSVEAENQDGALRQLRSQGLHIAELKREQNDAALGLFLRRTPSAEDLEFFTGELALLLGNGVKLDRGLAILGANQRSAALGRVVRTLNESLRRGQPLSEAMGAFPALFSPLYLNLVALGEASGDLASVFKRLSEDLQFQGQLRRKLSQALTYPALIFAVCVLSIVFVFNFIVPQLATLFDGMASLPGYTQVLLGVSAFFQSYQWFLAGAAVLGAVALGSAWRRPELRARLLASALKVPGLRSFLLQAEQVRLNAALAMMLASGVPIDRSLRLATGSLQTESLARALDGARRQVNSGAPLATALAATPLYSSFFQSLIEVGEESGDLLPVFEEIKRRARNDFESKVERFTTLLEPLLIVFMGAVVGGVVVTMLLSIVAVNDVNF